MFTVEARQVKPIQFVLKIPNKQMWADLGLLAISRSFTIANELNQNNVSAEHLLVSLAYQPEDDPAARIIRDAGLTPDELRKIMGTKLINKEIHPPTKIFLSGKASMVLDRALSLSYEDKIKADTLHILRQYTFDYVGHISQSLDKVVGKKYLNREIDKAREKRKIGYSKDMLHDAIDRLAEVAHYTPETFEEIAQIIIPLARKFESLQMPLPAKITNTDENVPIISNHLDLNATKSSLVSLNASLTHHSLRDVRRLRT